MSLLLATLLLAAAPPISTVTMSAEKSLPIYQPKSSVERAGVNAALASLDTLGEGTTVALILRTASGLMNLSDDDVDPVRDLLAARYQELDDDPRWSDVPTPLYSALRSEPPSMLIVPPAEGDPEDAPVVVFLHGYGGSGTLFSFLLARALPHAWIVAPSHGVSWARPNVRYLDRALARFEKETGLRSPRYQLVGLSDGGVGAFEVLAARPDRFERAVSIVGVPRADTIARLPVSVPLLMLNGKGDRFVGERAVKARWARLSRRMRDAKLEWFAGGHYFLLDDDAKALARVRAFLGPHPRR